MAETNYLVFHLYAPLASWGDVAVGETRPSRTHPGRSALLGLLGAALGLRREQETELAGLAAGYRFAVGVPYSGQLLRDYHTIQIPRRVAMKHYTARTRREEVQALKADMKGNATLLSAREYRCDARYHVVVETTQQAPYSLETLAEALRRPRFTLYLGRKSCPPALPLAPQILTARSALHALNHATAPPWADLVDHLHPGRIKTDKAPAIYWEDGMDMENLKAQIFITRDEPVSRRGWRFRERREYRAPWPQAGQEG